AITRVWVGDRALLAGRARLRGGRGEGNVARRGHAVRLGFFTDARGDIARALRDDPGRGLARLVLERDGDVRGVDEHDVGITDGSDHPVAAHGELACTALALDERVAVGVLVLVLDLFLGHARLLQ